MVSFHVWTLIWIIVLLFVLAPMVDGDNKRRATHRHRHHRHRKHPKHHPAAIKNSFAEKHARKINITILNTVARLPTESSTSLLFPNSGYPVNDTITSLPNLSMVEKTSNINLNNSSSRPNATSGFVKENNISSTSMKNIVENWPSIPTGIIDGLVDPNYLSLETSTIAEIGSRSPDTSSKEDHRRYAKDLRVLFGSPEDRTNLPKILMDTPIVQLVRKKRSIPSEEAEAPDESSRERTLLDFNGPSIASDPEELLDRESSESLHKRVKRDGAEPEVMSSALSSQDSNYFHDLEDSFALSALEVEAREARGSASHRRTARQNQSGTDSLPSLSRPKRYAEDDKSQSYDTKGQTEFKKMPSADYITENDNADSIEKTHEIEDSKNASSRDLLTGGTDRGVIGVFGPAGASAKGVDNFSRTTLDLERPDNTTYSLDSSTSPVATAPEAEDNKTDPMYLDSSSRSSGPDNYTVKGDEPITGYRVEDSENVENASSASLGSREMNGREVEEKNLQPEVESDSVGSSLKDDNSISRYGLDDVYPEIVDAANPSPMARLIRTKRFGDGIGNREASEDSYASEVDNGRVAEEPYAEDNGIIDSMLSKVDYRSGYVQPERSARNENEARAEEEGIYSPVRKKRGVSSRRARKKGGQRRGSKKRKKGREGRGRKHHRPKLKRSKMKRESDDLSEGMNSEWEEKFEPGEDNFDARRLEAIDEEVISPHDGRRRRVSEDEDDENFYPDTNEAAGRYRRDLRDSGIVDKNSEGHRDEGVRSISPWIEGPSKLNEKPTNREKRDNGLRELKYFQSIREANGGQNRSEETADKRLLSVDAVKPIRDIEQIVEALLAKVNELHGYVSEVGTDGATEESQSSGNASSTADRTTAEVSKVVDGVTTSQDGSSSRPPVANVEGQSGACRKYPASWTQQSGSAKSNGRSARNSRAQRCSKKARRKRTSHRKWDRWTDWSSCSVTCGRGRQIRWRHCIRNCSTAETEMEEKACQLPACAPGKFLGIFG